MKTNQNYCSMKKIIFAAAVLFSTCVFLSCTEQARVRSLGGNMTIRLEPGERLMMATWKESDLFYLTEPMEEDYQPKTKIFRESSSWGVAEAKITFVECR